MTTTIFPLDWFASIARGGSHVEALKHAPDTELPITEGARHILRAMRPKERQR